MSGGERLSNRDRENYLIRLKKEFAYAGVNIPERITVDGGQIRLRSCARSAALSCGRSGRLT
jgi:hypothetical protein